MNCMICEKECDSGQLFFGEGITCSKECSEEKWRQLRAYHKELAGEPLGVMPDTLDVPAFDRWTLKLAIHILKSLSAEQRANMNPLLTIPNELALELKEKIVRKIPSEYVETEDVTGHARLFYSGTFSFPQPLPAAVLHQAAQAAGVIDKEKGER